MAHKQNILLRMWKRSSTKRISRQRRHRLAIRRTKFLIV